MKYQITSDNMSVTDSMKFLVQAKLEKLERRWEDIPDDSKFGRIVLNKGPNETFEVKIEISLDGETFFSSESGYELETALIDTVDELDRIYRKKKEKISSEKWKDSSRELEEEITKELIKE